MQDSPDPVQDLAWAILEQAADDQHNRSEAIRQDALAFLEGGYPLTHYVSWLPVDVQQQVERILES